MLKLIIPSFLLLAISCKKSEEKSETLAKNVDSVKVSDNTNKTTSLSKSDSVKNEIAHYIVSQYLSEGDLRVLEEKDRKFNFQQIDLNNDGKPETFISFSGSYFCGTGGCSSVLLDENMKAITKFTVTTPPFYIDKASENGWSVIYLKDRNKWKKLVYSNGKYPSNPSVLKDVEKPDLTRTILVIDSTLQSKPLHF